VNASDGVGPLLEQACGLAADFFEGLPERPIGLLGSSTHK
jgi:hypothetical protein